MSQAIIYNQDNGIPAVMVVSEEAIERFGLMAVAQRDVPKGKPFKIINMNELPEFWPQETWEIDESELTDGVGGSITSSREA